MQGNVLLLSYPAIKFIHFELAVVSYLTAELHWYLWFLSAQAQCFFQNKNRQQISIYLSVLFPSKANIVSFKICWPCINMKRIPIYWKNDSKYNVCKVS